MLQNMKPFLLATLILFVVGGCGFLKEEAEEKAEDSGDPSAQGTGAMAANAVAGVADFVSDMLNNLNVPSAKPSKTALAFPPSVACSGDGNIAVTEDGLTFTATATNCVENNGTVVANVIVTGTLLGTVSCPDGGDGPFLLPSGLTTSMNGTIEIGGVPFTLENLGMAFTNIEYTPETCSISAFTDTITGKISTDDPVEVELNFGTGGVILDVQVESNQAVVSMDGSMSVDTPCSDDSFSIVTISPMIFPEGETCPVSGQLSLSDDLSGTVTFPDDCEEPACVFGF